MVWVKMGCKWAMERWDPFFFFLLSKVGIFDEEVFLRSFVEGANTCAVVIHYPPLGAQKGWILWWCPRNDGTGTSNASMRNPEPEAPFLRPNPTLKESGYLEAQKSMQNITTMKIWISMRLLGSINGVELHHLRLFYFLLLPPPKVQTCSLPNPEEGNQLIGYCFSGFVEWFWNLVNPKEVCIFFGFVGWSLG